ncbi:TBC1 domain family member 13 [Folsomia candida]|uniref:TBC1 domain family member 5 n=1 Tax=Folsomia candida TaxID=158441 RepID=A0A226F0B9_FOLCA|nr:TBC1 domain family member 13 [Folsomia candida]XP_035705324.1 TBC1 domain family member 13 [Folsomia candida]OXA62837.1 TBC1 domain family member 5 [Folsomia candida]
MSYRERMQRLELLLGEAVINLEQLKELVFHGLPGDGSARPLVWRLLLNYLPASREEWGPFLAKKRTNYGNFVADLLQPCCAAEEAADAAEEADHPLNPNPDSRWQQFFRDNEVLLQIDKDVRRLLPEIAFFQSATKYPCEQIVSGAMARLHERVGYVSLQAGSIVKRGIGLITKTSTGTSSSSSDGGCRPNNKGGESHWEVVERILFVYAKLNPGQSYVQGMNEIMGPLYYVLATDADEEWARWAEADTFYIFTHLMGEVRDFFIRSLDNSTSGIRRMMEILMRRVGGRDTQVARLLAQQEIHPQYYAFRWITLLLSQEFPLPDVLRIWDSLLADRKRFDFLVDLCCAMIIHVRGELLSGDFATNMKLLQNYPPIDVRDILALASTFSEKGVVAE